MISIKEFTSISKVYLSFINQLFHISKIILSLCQGVQYEKQKAKKNYKINSV